MIPLTAVNFSDISYSFGTASWSIDIFGRTTNAKRIAKAYKEQLEDFEQASKSELVAAVSSLYFTLQMLDAQILATDAAEANWASSVEEGSATGAAANPGIAAHGDKVSD